MCSDVAQNVWCVVSEVIGHNIPEDLHMEQCSFGINGTYCLDLLGTSFNAVVPTRTALLNPVINAAIESCANYSSFESETCPVSAKMH